LEREAVPVASDGQCPLPHAQGTFTRRSKGQSQRLETWVVGEHGAGSGMVQGDGAAGSVPRGPTTHKRLDTISEGERDLPTLFTSAYAEHLAASVVCHAHWVESHALHITMVVKPLLPKVNRLAFAARNEPTGVPRLCATLSRGNHL
jgi:hypothetical protein